jgi:hypothetical protein
VVVVVIVVHGTVAAEVMVGSVTPDGERKG